MSRWGIVIALALALAAGACGSGKSDKPSAGAASGAPTEAERQAAAHTAVELNARLDDLSRQTIDAMRALQNATSKDEQLKAQQRVDDLTKQRMAVVDQLAALAPLR